MKWLVLVVEDEKPLRDAFALLLRHEGFDVELAENGKAALAKLEQAKPHLILLDLLMPVMNGEEFLQAANLPANYPDTKVLMLSNLSDPLTPEEARDLGITHSILKSDLSPVDLARVIKKMLSIDT